MSSVFGKSRRLVSVSIIALLIGVQTISIAHAYEHDPESVQGTACATCASISHLAAAAIDNGHCTAPRGFKWVSGNHRVISIKVVDLYTPRVRGPPATP